jgi:hypothetical protein
VHAAIDTWRAHHVEAWDAANWWSPLTSPLATTHPDCPALLATPSPLTAVMRSARTRRPSSPRPSVPMPLGWRSTQATSCGWRRQRALARSACIRSTSSTLAMRWRSWPPQTHSTQVQVDPSAMHSLLEETETSRALAPWQCCQPMAGLWWAPAVPDPSLAFFCAAFHVGFGTGSEGDQATS